MKLSHVSLLMVLLLSSVGCLSSSGEQGAGTTNPEVAQQVRSQVEEFVTAAQKSPRNAPANLSLMIESLEGASDRSEAFVHVQNEAQKLQELYQGKAAKDEIATQLTQLQEAANQLVTNEN